VAAAAILAPVRPDVPTVPAGSTSGRAILPATFTVTSILWSRERQLALVDGVIRHVGDTVDGARIIEIQQDAVLVSDRAGRLRRASLVRPGNPES
jgi:hypothetical protein